MLGFAIVEPHDRTSRGSRRPVILAAVGLLLLAPMAARAQAVASDSASAPPIVAVPDSVPARDAARLSTMQFMIKSLGNVEVATGETRVRTRRASVSAEGVTFNPHDSAVTSLRDPMENQFVPWAEIDSVRVRRGGGAGPVFGALAGLAVGLTIVAAEAAADEWSGDSPSATPLVVSVLAGGTLGWLVDHAGPWHRVYP